MHEVLVNRLGGLSLPRKSVIRVTDRPDMTLDVYRGRITTTQQQQKSFFYYNYANYLKCPILRTFMVCVHLFCLSLLDEDPIAGGERVKLHGTDDLTKFNDICDTAYAYNEAHYSILVKKGK